MHKAFVIRPKHKLPVNPITHNTKLMKEMYDSGRELMRSKLYDLKQFLN